MRIVSPRILLLALALSLPLALVAGLMLGTVQIAPLDVLVGLSAVVDPVNRDEIIVSSIRLPRVLLAALVGSCLAVCGAAMQGLFRNPLADPSLIGVSSGASAGASLMIVFAGGWLAGGSQILGLSAIALGAFIGGFAAVLLVYRLATTVAGTSVATMLLAGIAISALAGALNSLFSYIADDEMLRRISLWQMGSLDAANWQRVTLAATACVPLLLVLRHDSRALNAFLLGESEAWHLGIDVQAVKRRLVFLTAFAVGIAVAVSGIIAFVGLIVPHIVRLLIGPDHRYLVPASAFGGAILLVTADAAARTLIAPSELPAGILTALVGAPFFFALLARRRGPGSF